MKGKYWGVNKMGDLININAKYQGKLCLKVISGKWALTHLKMRHGIDLGSWKSEKVLKLMRCPRR